MKSFKTYLLIAVFALSTVFAPSAFTSATRPVRGIDVVVQKNPGTSSRQTATPNPDGTFSVILPGAGIYTIKYASGPDKGKVITTVTATKAGLVGLHILQKSAE